MSVQTKTVSLMLAVAMMAGQAIWPAQAEAWPFSTKVTLAGAACISVALVSVLVFPPGAVAAIAGCGAGGGAVLASGGGDAPAIAAP